MRKFMLMAVLFMFALSCQAFGAVKTPQIYLDGILFQYEGEAPYFDENQTLMVPADMVEALFWCDLVYDSGEGTATITKKDTVIVFRDNNTQYSVNGEKIVMPMRANMNYLPAAYIAQALNAELKYNAAQNRIDIIGGIYTLKDDLDLERLTAEEIQRIMLYSGKYPPSFLENKMLAYERILGSADTLEGARGVVYERFKEVGVYPTSITQKLEDKRYYGFTVTWNYYPENSITPIPQSAEVIVTKNTFYDFPEMTFVDLNSAGVRELLNLMYYVETYSMPEIQVLKTAFTYGKETLDHSIYYLEQVEGEDGGQTYKIGKRTYQIDNETGFVANVNKENLEWNKEGMLKLNAAS